MEECTREIETHKSNLKEEYEVEKILKKRTISRESKVSGKIKRIKQYLVKWVGFKDPTWEPEKNLEHCEDIIKAFLLKNNSKNNNNNNSKKLKKNKEHNSPNKIENIYIDKNKLLEPFNILEQSTSSSTPNKNQEVFKRKNNVNKKINNKEMSINIPLNTSEYDNNPNNCDIDFDFDFYADNKDEPKINKIKEEDSRNSNNNNNSFLTIKISDESDGQISNSNSKQSNNNSFDYLMENENKNYNKSKNKNFINIKNEYNVSHNNEESVLDRLDQIDQTFDIEVENSENISEYSDYNYNTFIKKEKNVNFLSKKRLNQNNYISHNNKDNYKILEILNMKVPVDYNKGIKLNIKYKKDNNIYIKEFDTKYEYVPNDILIKYYEMFIRDIFRTKGYYRKLSFE